MSFRHLLQDEEAQLMASSRPMKEVHMPQLHTPNSRMWDELRREARKVESEVDAKLAAYSRLGSSYSLSVGSNAPPASEVEADQRAAEIERLLDQLQVINGAMAECSRGSSSDLLAHTMARHSDILHEYTQEFVRTRKNVTASLQHAQLLGARPSRSRSASALGEAGGTTSQQALLRERAAIQSAASKADEVIGQAQATSASLQQQRGLFTDVLGKVTDLSQKFPLVNTLLTTIRRKKSRDNLILSGVVVVCTILLLIYWLSK